MHFKSGQLAARLQLCPHGQYPYHVRQMSDVEGLSNCTGYAGPHYNRQIQSLSAPVQTFTIATHMYAERCIA
jgi:hypothetical protein